MQLECYFSHSWSPRDVELNVLVWETIAEVCVLYVDREGASGAAYYVNRLEELIRKSDVFVSVLSFRESKTSDDRRPDYRLSCSPGSLFEVRLAERARKPRWIIYDDRTGFLPPDSRSDLVIYTPISTGEELERGGNTIRTDGGRWLNAIQRTLSNTPKSTRSRRAALLLDDDEMDVGQVAATVVSALKRAGYPETTRIEAAHTDAEAIAILQASSLLVAEIGAQSIREMYGMAHAMFVPTIRFMREKPTGMPRLLEGHPGGYQHDLIFVSESGDLGEQVEKRAAAMRDQRAALSGIADGCAYLRGCLYRKHQVFFSHNLRAEDADLLAAVFRKLHSRGIRAWEYRNNNKAGVEWRQELKNALEQASDVVFLLDENFELSQVCDEEMDSIMRRRECLQTITPFLWGARVRPNPKLSGIHHETLPADKEHAANVVVQSLVKQLAVPA
jgi:TIR domain